MSRSSPITVLLVDDNSNFLETLTSFLKEYSDIIVVGAAHGGKEGLKMAESLRPEVILVDLVMPDQNGLVTIAQLRQIEARFGIVALTLYDTRAYMDAALLSGADEFVSKAKLGADLVPAIRRVMQSNGSAESEKTETKVEKSSQAGSNT